MTVTTMAPIGCPQRVSGRITAGVLFRRPRGAFANESCGATE